MLHERWNDGWELLEVEAPVKLQDALEMDGWRRV